MYIFKFMMFHQETSVETIKLKHNSKNVDNFWRLRFKNVADTSGSWYNKRNTCPKINVFVKYENPVHQEASVETFKIRETR